jgi:hypothetical protein
MNSNTLVNKQGDMVFPGPPVAHTMIYNGITGSL